MKKVPFPIKEMDLILSEVEETLVQSGGCCLYLELGRKGRGYTVVGYVILTDKWKSPGSDVIKVNNIAFSKIKKPLQVLANKYNVLTRTYLYDLTAPGIVYQCVFLSSNPEHTFKKIKNLKRDIRGYWSDKPLADQLEKSDFPDYFWEV